MKKVGLLLTGAMIAGTVFAQVVKENEAALVYYSPKTAISLEFSYTVETLEAGPFAEYAEELLGVNDWISENKTTYTLSDVRIGTKTYADYLRPHKVSADAGIPLLLTINEKGLLIGYNIPYSAKEPYKNSPNKDEGKVSKREPIQVAPYSEEILKANDSTSMVEAVAEQILHLRETRMYLLSGELEHAPADGSSMKQVLAELDKQENALTELFVGKRTQKVQKKFLTVQPDQEESLFFFSAENGFTDGDNVDADTIRVEISLQAQSYLPASEQAEPVAEPKNKKKNKELPPVQQELSPIVYNLPGSAAVQVVYSNHILAEKNLKIAQIGIDIPLPKSLFTGDELPVIVFDEKTGNVQSITK